MRELLSQLASHALDVVLSNESAPRDTAAGWISHRIAQQPMSLVSVAPVRGRRKPAPLKFPEDLQGQPLILPSQDSAVRLAFDLALEEAGVRPNIVAEVDDMAMLRLLARETGALALVAPVVVRDELHSGLLVERCTLGQLQENFYAITVRRRFAHPALRPLLGRV